MFQFPRFPLPVLCVQTGVTPHYRCWVSPFGHLRIKARSTAPRSISQPTTSFIGSRRQGIHRWHFVAWKNKDAHARYAVVKVREVVIAIDKTSSGQQTKNGNRPEPRSGFWQMAALSKRNRGSGYRTAIKREICIYDRRLWERYQASGQRRVSISE